MTDPVAKSGRLEGSMVVGLALLWIGLWLLPQYLWIPIPPFREDSRWSDSALLNAFAHVWAALLLLIPGLLPVLAGGVTRRFWKRPAPASHLGLIGLCLLSVLPLLVVAVGILRRMAESPFTDTVAPPLFYWWPR
jgi:hypothetical protein